MAVNLTATMVKFKNGTATGAEFSEVCGAEVTLQADNNHVVQLPEGTDYDNLRQP